MGWAIRVDFWDFWGIDFYGYHPRHGQPLDLTLQQKFESHPLQVRREHLAFY